MESEIYLNQQDHTQAFKLIIRGITYKELGVQWVAERGQYKIVNKKRWLLTKIKYEI